MICMRVDSIVLAASISALFGCSSADTVVAANVQSSNDTQYSSITDSGKKGGLIKPGLPDGILNPGSTTPDLLRSARKVRFTLSQSGQASIAREVALWAVNKVGVEEPIAAKTSSWSFDVLDASGAKVLDAEGNPTKESHVAIGLFFERITLTDSWRGEGQAMAEAVDDSGSVLVTASVPFQVEEHGAVYVPIDLKLPEPPPAPQGGAGGEGGSAGTGNTSTTAGTAGTAGTADNAGGTTGTSLAGAGGASG